MRKRTSKSSDLHSDWLAQVDVDDPTLGGLCERCWLTTEEDDDLPPAGAKKLITFTIRLRSGDRLGRSPVSGGSE